jgi:hypothetical protein
MNLQKIIELAGSEIRAAMDELNKQGIKIRHVDVTLEPPVSGCSGAAEYVRIINARMTPNVES